MSNPTKCPHCGAEVNPNSTGHYVCGTRTRSQASQTPECEIASLRQQLAEEKAKREEAEKLIGHQRSQIAEWSKESGKLLARLEAAEAERGTLINLLKRAQHWLESHRVAFDSSEATDKLIADITATLEGKPTRDAEGLLKEAELVLEKLGGAYERVRPYVPSAKDTDAPVGWLAETMQITYGDLRKAATLLAKIRMNEMNEKPTTPPPSEKGRE